MVALLQAIRRRRPVHVVECRRCGTNVDGTPTSCPTCGGTGFATYEIR